MTDAHPSDATSLHSRTGHLQRLLKKCRPLKNFRDLKRLRTLLAIASGKPANVTKRAAGISLQGIRNIRRELDTKGWEAVVTEIERRLDNRNAKAEAESSSRLGRPPLASLQEFEKIQEPQREQVVALAGISMSARAQTALFAVRTAVGATKLDDPSLVYLNRQARLVSLVEKLLQSQDEDFPRDTGDPLCGPLVQAILDLEVKLKIQRHTPYSARGLHRDPAGGKTEAPSMHKDLLKGWHFFSLQAGEHEVLSGFEKRLVGERRCTVIHFDSEEFLCRLSKKIVSLRLHLPIIGLFPMDQLAFLASVQIWNPKTAEERFEWQWDVRDVNRVLLRRLAENCAYAAFGFLVRLSSRCRSKLGFSDKFPIDTLTLRPGVAVSPGNLEGIQGAIITYTPIPQTPVSEDFVRYKGSTSKLESMLRDQLKQHSSATRFEYCVRPSKEQRRAMTLPDKVVENVGLKVIRRSGEATDGSAAVISVPLCFAMHPPNVSLDQLLRYGEEMLKAKRIADVIVESGEEFLVFCFEPILYAIIKAFRRNAYGDRIAFLGLVQKQLQRKWEGVQSTGEFLSGGKRRFEPQFYFTEEELAAKDLSEVTKRRLSHCRIPSRAMSDNGVIQDKATHRYPGYSGTPTLYKTLVGLDADFLLRGVSEHHWASLVPAADEWKNLYGKAYADWLSTSYKNPELLRNLLSAECRTSWKENEDELRDLAFTTVDLLKERASRILRNAVENAQRLVMSGRQPSAIVVRKKSELIHLWKAYLRKFLTARTFERFNLKCQVDEAAESLCDDVFEDDDARKELDQFDE